jgi:hypothetical protein
MVDDTDQPERPRVEPEIIPPDRGGSGSDWRHAPWRADPYGGGRTTHRLYVTRLGPFGVALLLLAVAAIVALVTIVVLGAVLISIPVLAIVIALAALSRLLRGFGGR